MSQAWVTLAVNSGSFDSQDFIGRDSESDKRDAWTLRYVARFVEKGIPLQFAIETYSNGEHDYSDDPESAADDEMSYWDNDEEPG